MAFYIGVDIGGTKTAVLVGNERAETLARDAFATLQAGGPQTVLDRVARSAERLVSEVGVAMGEVRAIGISCGGPLDSGSGRVLGPPNLPGWYDVPVVEELQRRLGRPAYLQNDANAGALAEWRFGAGRGTRNMVFITAGTGFGAGLILDGRLYSGTNDMAGEIGHVRLRRHGPFAYGKAGSVDALCGGAGMAHVAREMMDLAARRGEQSRLFSLPRPVTARDVAEAAARHDPLAGRIIQRVGEYWGEALAVLVDILNPERIVLGSLAVRLGEAVLAPARRTLAREALPRSASICEIIAAQLGERLGDVAALCVAMRLGV